MRQIQIYLLVLLVVAGADADEPWAKKYAGADQATPAVAAPAKKTPRPAPPSQQQPTSPAPSGDNAVGHPSPPSSSWWALLAQVPDLNRVYERVKTDIMQTDDVYHRSIWSWFHEHPVLQFVAIILLSGAILAVVRIWWRACSSPAAASRKQ